MRRSVGRARCWNCDEFVCVGKIIGQWYGGRLSCILCSTLAFFSRPVDDLYEMTRSKIAKVEPATKAAPR